MDYDFAMIGLGVMGSNLLLNMADHGFKVIGYDTNLEKTKALEASAGNGQQVKGVTTLQEMVNLLQKPRKLMMLVPAGKAVDDVINNLLPLVEAGDIIIDGGNSHYTDTLRRIEFLKDKQLHFMGMGISGGEQGARIGPSIMPGGDNEAYNQVSPLLLAIAAKAGGNPCVAYMGKNAAGHYVKMVHNGIEYAIMQLISECYDLLHNGLGLDNDALGKVFTGWNSGEMKSYLVEITGHVFEKKDENSANYLVDMILDKAGAKGTGKWTSQEGLDLPMPVPSIDMAVMMRNISALADQRRQANEIYGHSPQKIDADKDKFIVALHDALLLSMIISYAQGFAMLVTASKELSMGISLPDVVNVWKGGCIIRSELLTHFSKAFEKNSLLENLLLDKDIAEMVNRLMPALVIVIGWGVSANYPMAGLTASYNYLTAFTRKSLPTNLIQAQRDFFGSHTYQRIDREGIFHTQWGTSL